MHPGRGSDISIFWDNIDWNEEITKKDNAGNDIENNGEHADAYGSLWAVLLDKENIEIQSEVREIFPGRKPANENLSVPNHQQNITILSNLVIFNIYHGHL